MIETLINVVGNIFLLGMIIVGIAISAAMTSLALWFVFSIWEDIKDARNN